MRHAGETVEASLARGSARRLTRDARLGGRGMGPSRVGSAGMLRPGAFGPARTAGQRDAGGDGSQTAGRDEAVGRRKAEDAASSHPAWSVPPAVREDATSGAGAPEARASRQRRPRGRRRRPRSDKGAYQQVATFEAAQRAPGGLPTPRHHTEGSECQRTDDAARPCRGVRESETGINYSHRAVTSAIRSSGPPNAIE
ncbi:hypothetical protein THAOC_14191 [Thalassiosira oceanica]|uniref:Uncharacterized protein n=1 Tax=Thalassiosira oceanica TaxID=159749 RepID=K0SJ66_THAOC|nr:hypothetical protein THAOC_14191 [Thalassiosira oceanica]|eukprot:EJK65014.1 hypothetical protein THAOC_14191 [Thalassiosira oceanica]